MRVAVFFGGKSCEHNISLITGMQVLKAVSARHEAVPVFIDRDGSFYTGGDLHNMRSFCKDPSACMKKKRVLLAPGSNKLYAQNGKTLAVLDAAVLAAHGYGGEDGCLQGLLTLCGIPYTGSGVAASAVGMDKILMKKLFEYDALPVLPYVGFSADEYKNDLFTVVETIKKSLRFPMIVKPAKLGSSIGISVVHDYPSLFESLAACFLWDNAAVVENALEGFTELNCAGLGRGGEVTTSGIERPVSASEFLTFRDKYVQKGKSAKREFPAKISGELAEKVKSFTRRAFCAVGASGVARVDFLYDGKELYVNEINTIPGALANYLFDELPFPELIDRLLDIALKAKEEADALTYVYEPAYELGDVGK